MYVVYEIFDVQFNSCAFLPPIITFLVVLIISSSAPHAPVPISFNLCPFVILMVIAQLLGFSFYVLFYMVIFHSNLQ